MYMAATCAAVHKPERKIFSDRLKAAGKKHKVVIAAILRKLVILANVLLWDIRHWTPEASASARG